MSDESFEELHRFAASLGIPQRGFDRDHYDIPAERYAMVVDDGVVKALKIEDAPTQAEKSSAAAILAAL